MRAIIVAVFATTDAAEVVARLDAAQIANARVNTMSEVWAHPLDARGRWFDVATPAGRVPALRPPGVADDEAAGSGAVPAVGEHTESILLELGLTSDEIERVRREGAV